MTKQKSTKRALLMSALALLMCVTMLIGSTFAWFTDSVTSAGNKIQAGNLDVDLYLWTAANQSVEITDTSDPIFGAGSIAQDNNAETLWEPGKTQVAYLSIKNNGSLDLKYKVAVDVRDADGEQDLYEVMKYAIINDAQYDTVTAWDSTKGVSVVPGVNATQANDVALKAGEEHFFALSIHMDESAGNEYMNGQVDFDVRVLATQLASEFDSFNNEYDKDATYVSAATADELKDAIAKGEPVALTEDITMDTGNFTVAADTKAVIDLGGNDLTLTNADTTAAFLMVNGDLTITGEGNVAARQINTSEGSTLTLGEGVTISTSNNFAINNQGTTVIDGATINHTGTNDAILNDYGTLIINDATVTSTSTKNISTISSMTGKVTINGGTFIHNGSMGSVICDPYGDSEIIINGGTFVQNGNDPLVNMNSFGILTVNGGTFDATSMFCNGEGNNITINAGVFKNNATVTNYGYGSISSMIPATSTATTNADGSITVTKN